MDKRILIVAAHPDDEILGCGGVIARLVKGGCEVYTLILGEGVTSRDKKRNVSKRRKEINLLKKQSIEANKIVGVKKVYFSHLPDNRFDTVPFLDIVKIIEDIKDKLKPEIVFTHYGNDLNIDHRIIYEAVITATRPLKNELVKEIYSFEVISSTEWNYPLTFFPDVFFDITETINQKLEALQKYSLELREFPHPRSIESVKLNAKMWGVKVGLVYAEAFKLVRVVR